MNPDGYGAQRIANDQLAQRAYENAARDFLRHRSPALNLMHALTCAPEHGGALALQGFCNVFLARRETLAQARLTLASWPRKRGDARDQAMRDALALCCAGRERRAVEVLRAWLAQRPCDIVAAKIVHALQFLSGSRDMEAVTSDLIGRIDPATPGYANLLGCHAFALEERAEFARAEAAAQAALHLDDRDLWAMHALAHVYEMTGRNREGVIWIESARNLWGEAGNFAHHLAWHLALFHLNLGKPDRALAVYDREVRAFGSLDFRDRANAVSLLWRLRQEGIDVGPRFEELAEIARGRGCETTLVFAALHDLLAFIAVGDDDGAAALMDALRAEALGGRHQSKVAAHVGLPLAQALMAFARQGKCNGEAFAILGQLQDLGGSHAQRDVFLRSLALMAAQANEGDLLDIVLGLRHQMRRADRFLVYVETLARTDPVSRRAIGRIA